MSSSKPTTPAVRVPLVDLRFQHAALEEPLRAAFDSFFEAPGFILGEAVARFEQNFAAFLGVEHAIAVSSGTDALLCSLLALGVGPGDEVITTPFTFVSTAEVIRRVGATPRFVDIDPGSFNLDPKRLETSISPRTRAIIPVHLFGEPADLSSILAIAKQHGVATIEDAAQALGSEYRGAAVGTQGELGCFSFFPSKPLGGWGDGGMIVSRDAELAARCRQLRSHGKDDQGLFTRLGGNFRLDALQAAVLDVKLPHLSRWCRERREIAEHYSERLARIAAISVPREAPGSRSVFAQYVIRVPGERDRLAAHLRTRSVETAVYYRTPLHLEPVFADLASYPDGLPEAERAAREALALPLYVGLDRQRQSWVIDAIEEFFLGERTRG